MRRFALASALALVLVYGPHLGGAFVWDDVHLIEHNAALREVSGLAEVFSRDQWGQATGRSSQLYRPLPTATVWAQVQLGGLSLPWLRCGNLFVHWLTVLLAVRWQRRHGVATGRACAVGALLLLHPLCVEPVMWLTGRNDSLAAALALGALLSAPAAGAGGRRWLCSVVAGSLVALAFLSKESALALPAMLVGQRQIEVRRGAPAQGLWHWLDLVPSVALLGAAVAWRTLGVGVSLGSTRLAAGLAEHVSAHAAVVGHYLWEMVALHCGPTLEPYRPPGAWPTLWLSAAPLTGTGLTLWWARRDRRLGAAALLGWWCTWWALAPSVAAVPSLGLYGNRYGYLALMVFGVTLGALAEEVWTRSLTSRVRPWVLAGLAALALMVGATSALEASTWRDNLTLYHADLVEDPDNGYALYHYGTAVVAAQGCEAALPYFLRALETAPRYERPWHNAAGCLIRLGRAAEAVPFARRALELDPQRAANHHNLGLALTASGQPAEARVHLQRARELAPRGGGSAVRRPAE